MEIIKAGPNTATYPRDPLNQTEVALYLKGVAAVHALEATTVAYAAYLNGPFHSWLISYTAGRAVEPPPPVPMGFDAQIDDEATQFDLISSGQPAGAPPFYEKLDNPLPNTGGFGGLRPPVRPPLLIGQIGDVVTQIDGTKWQRVS